MQPAGHRFHLCCKVSRCVQDGLTQNLVRTFKLMLTFHLTQTTGWWFVVLREMSCCTVTFPSGWIVPSLIVAPPSDQILTESYILFYDQISTKHKAFQPTGSGGGERSGLFLSPLPNHNHLGWMQQESPCTIVSGELVLHVRRRALVLKWLNPCKRKGESY